MNENTCLRIIKQQKKEQLQSYINKLNNEVVMKKNTNNMDKPLYISVKIKLKEMILQAYSQEVKLAKRKKPSLSILDEEVINRVSNQIVLLLVSFVITINDIC